MGIIRELDYNTVVKIAAGEIIDRPASVVRELVDNAIDAGATAISVHISEGGKGYIEVCDDGAGMDRNDLEICYKNHTTSKIGNFDDISSLHTLGFRGEALSSIAEAAYLKINTRKKGEIGGYSLEVKNGTLESLKETGLNTGTCVIVQNLFENIPARKKFLSSDTVELKWIDKEIVKKALAFPGISFELVAEGKRKYISPSRKSYLERIADFFPDVLNYLLPLEFASEQGSILGFASKPAFIRSNRMYQMMFVNGRAVDWRNFYFAVNNAYGNLIPRGYFPAVFLYLEIPAGQVDVNVHPMKREVRFHNDVKIEKSVREAIYRAINTEAGISEADDSIVSFTPFEKRVGEAISGFLSNEKKFSEYAQPFSRPSFLAEKPVNPADAGPENLLFEKKRQLDEKGDNAGTFKDCRFVGVVFRTYIILEREDSIFFFDQHAAHERINYEKLKEHYKSNLLSPQELLIPVTLDVPVGTTEDFKDGIGLLQSMGFDVEHFGGNSFVVRSAPAYIDYNAVGDVLTGFVETLEENKDAHSADFIDSAMKQMACKSSVRGGEVLSKEECLALIEEWEKTPNRFSCPHGRPVVFSLPKNDIDKMFKRLGF